MPIPGSNIRMLRRQMGYSLRDISRATGIDAGNLSSLENGKIGYSRDAIDKIAKVLQVSIGVLFADPGVVEAAALHMRQAPLLTDAQLAAWRGPDDFDYDEDQQFLYIPLDRTSRYVFARVVEDKLNEPVLVAGDELVFDANRKPDSGDLVAAQSEDGAVTVGRLLVVPGGIFHVLPFNGFARSLMSSGSPGPRLRGTLVELRRRF